MIWELLFIWCAMTFGTFILFVVLDAAVRWAWARVRS